MQRDMISYRGVEISKESSPFVKHMDVFEEYREELTSLSKSWDNLALLSHFGNNNTNINETKNNFSDLTSTLLNHLSTELLDKCVREMKFKAQISIDILIRNLFERTADIGFLSTDQDIRKFLLEHNNKYEKDYEQHAQLIKERFAEYIQKYSVYYNIVLMDTHGNILVELEKNGKIEKSSDEIVNLALHTNDEYVETFKYHDFIPDRKKSLVYTSKVTKDNNPNSETIGVLCLCFRFKDEMRGIFNNLKNEKNKECLTILDKEGMVIATSDTTHIPLGTILPYNLHEKYQLLTHGGRDYLAKTCKTNGYQGYMGQEWYGHIMLPVDSAFLEEEENLNVDQNILLAILQQGQGFSEDLKKIPLKANKIQSNLNRLVWNGNINKSSDENANRNFARALLNEISSTGEKTKQIFDLSIANLTKTIVLNNTSYVASLMIDIMDRNLYERANDCRWWALTDAFKEVLSDNSIEKDTSKLEDILKYINNLYTVYTNLFIYDNNGIILAVSNESQKHLVGKQLGMNVIQKTQNITDTNDYFVSNFERSKLYNDEHTYIYYASINNKQGCIGGIGVVFDSTVEFKAILEESIPGFDKAKSKEVFGVFANKDKTIISSSNDELKIGEVLNIDDKFFNLKNGESYSEIIVYEGNYYAVGVKCSQGYREYKISDNYSNDVYSIFFSYISSANLDISQNREIFTETPNIHEHDTTEIATFFVGGKWLGVPISDVIEAVHINKMDLSPTIDNQHYFKGTVVHDNKAVAVIDIQKFVDEQDVEQYNEIVVVKNFVDNSDNYIGILVNALGDIPEIQSSRIKTLDEHLLGNCTLINSIVTPLENTQYDKLLSILDIKNIKENLVE